MTEGASKLQIAERHVDGITVLKLSGEMTADDGDIVFGKRMDDLMGKGEVKLVVNLADVKYIDSAGVGMMVAKAKMVRQKGGGMKLAHLTARSHHLLAMVKLRVVLEVFDDEDAALRSFAWGPRP